MGVGRNPPGRALGAVVISILGTAFVLASLVVMARTSSPDMDRYATAAQSFDVKPPSKPPPQKKPREQKKKPRKSPAPPIPTLGASLTGLSFGIAGLDALAGVDDALLGDVSSVVMTEDSVDSTPEPLARTAAEYPARARQKGIEGYVTVSLLVTADGQVRDAKVVDAQPPGVFDDAALSTIRSWTFRPATYEGVAVSVRVHQTLRFALQ